jgi:hypothetical protein
MYGMNEKKMHRTHGDYLKRDFSFFVSFGKRSTTKKYIYLYKNNKDKRKHHDRNEYLIRFLRN